jgi:formylglycine-generating enzyme required for sulfatase activity
MLAGLLLLLLAAWGLSQVDWKGLGGAGLANDSTEQAGVGVANIDADGNAQKQYDALVASADSLMAQGQYASATERYEAAAKSPHRAADLDGKLKTAQAKATEQRQQQQYLDAKAKADRLFAAQKYQEAQKAYEDLLQLKPGDPHATGQRAECKKRLTTKPVTPDPLPPAAEGETITVNGVSFKMIPVQGGTFTMGCTSEQGSDCSGDERPVHQVTVSTYYMGETEVTQRLWEAVMGSNPSHFKNCPECPVEQVSWEDAQEFIQKLNRLTGKTFRLPTEAEWEYAARGTSASLSNPTSASLSNPTKYAGSNNVDEVAWHRDNSGGKTHKVKGKRPNELGLYDMSGNVWEWCEDVWHDNYNGAPTDGRPWMAGGNFGLRVIRGGAWGYDAGGCRVSDRSNCAPTYRGFSIGFRVVASRVSGS